MPISIPDIQLLAGEELRRRQERVQFTEEVEQGWEGWLRQMFPRQFTRPFGLHHRQFWKWVWGVRRGERSRPFVGIWPRGGGKSQSAESASVALGARGARRYAVYVSGTQDQADARVQNIAAMLESRQLGLHYPLLGRRAVGKYGSARGWRRNRLWTRHGLVVDALGLDVAAVRGMKVEDQRPDLIILDDLDARHDTPNTTRKKIDTITQTVLPIGSDDVAVLAVQNVILADGIFARLADGRADFLVNRQVSGPIPAVYGLRTEPQEGEDGRIRQVIVAGEPSWPGQSLEVCQGLIDDLGYRAFEREQQHNVQHVEGALWRPELIRHVAEVRSLLHLVRVVVGVDPSGGGEEIGIVAAGLTANGRAVVLSDVSQPGRRGVDNWTRAVRNCHEDLEADLVIAERNFGGDMVKKVIEDAAAEDDVPMRVRVITASRGKQARAEPVVQKYENGEVVHLGAHPELEAEMLQWVPGTPGYSPNRVDALVWALTELFWGGPVGPIKVTWD